MHTTYNIGSPRWLFFMTPLLRRVVTGNYHVLMADDIPMRLRRGQLRQLGYSFLKPGDTYGFAQTRHIMEENLCPPKDASKCVTANYVQLLADKREALAGDAGLLGFRLVRQGDEVAVYPRACPHEGASLDASDCAKGSLKCQWHGRVIPPIGRFAWGQEAQFGSPAYRVRVAGDSIAVEYVPPDARREAPPV